MPVANLKGFVGAAGTGKTYNLVREAELVAGSQQLESYQTLLGLSYMHGARRRLVSSLSNLNKSGIPVYCSTIDSFCLDIVRRFRRYLGYTLNIELNLNMNDSTYCECKHRNIFLSISRLRNDTLKLLQNSTVRQCISASYPIIIVDEFQDCDGLLLKIIKMFSKNSRLYVAADPFQKLTIEEDSENDDTCEAVDWLKNSSELIQLQTIERTNESALLNTAEALRNDKLKDGCIEVKPVDGSGLAAWEISVKIAWKGWGKDTSIVIISPVNKGNRFIDSTMKSLQKKLGQRTKIGPYPFVWEKSEQEKFNSIKSCLPLPDKDNDLVGKEDLKKAAYTDDWVVLHTCKSAIRIANLRGDSGIEYSELINISQKCLHGFMAYRSTNLRYKRLALTVHGAKNREFDYVIVLWPYRIPSERTYRRKLLYNAITRARKDAVIIVQGGKKRVDTDDVLSLLN